MLRASTLALLCALLAAQIASGQQKFSELVGNLQVKPVRSQTPVEVPFITWGGDVATFHANGGLTTAKGSTYDKLGIQMRLTPGDDFVAQVRNYVTGQTPFLRGTLRMLGQASEVLGADPATKPVVILQLSFSAGDHIVSRDSVQTLNDLKPQGGKKVRIACQQGGPHVGLLYDSLSAAGIKRDDVEIVWVDDLTGPNGAAAKFRSDATIAACCVITPDMLGLTGGMEATGTGAEGTVKGARVLNSTQSMSRSIADVVAVRSDWYKKNREFVRKFVSGYLKGTEDVVKMRNGFEESGRMAGDYQKTLAMAQSIFGKEVLPTLEIDAHGLLLDCTFVGVPGQISFFQDKTNLAGFDRKMSESLDLATEWGYAGGRYGFDPVNFDYVALSKLSGVTYAAPKDEGRFEDVEGFVNIDGDELDENTILSFTVNFAINDDNFSADRFGAEFRRAIESASTFGNAVVMIRGHADPTNALKHFVLGGLEKKTIRRTGQRGNYRYYLRDGKQLDLTSTDDIIGLIQSGAFETSKHPTSRIVQAALTLSKRRADRVKEEIIKFAGKQEIKLDESQLKPVGAGIGDPLIPRPTTREQAAENRRVEFLIIKVDPEALSDEAFEF